MRYSVKRIRNLLGEIVEEAKAARAAGLRARFDLEIETSMVLDADGEPALILGAKADLPAELPVSGGVRLSLLPQPDKDNRLRLLVTVEAEPDTNWRWKK